LNERALADIARQGNVAAMGFDDVPANRQSESRAMGFAPGEKRFKDVREGVRRDAASIIPDPDDHIGFLVMRQRAS
jgi:hypothetical protein